MKPRQIITAHEPVVCEICRRTLLRGETPVGFVADGRPVKVCELCEPRAAHEGWIPEGTPIDAQAAARRRARPSLLRRLRGEAPATRRERPSVLDEPRPAPSHHEDRQVHGVPTNAELRLERAIEMYNASGLPHRMAGITRSLGSPVVSVRPAPSENSIVRITIAWELAWYRFEVDLGDHDGGVRPVARGNELRELDQLELTPTNAMSDDGQIVDAA